MTVGRRVVVADPGPIFRTGVARLLGEHGFDVLEARNAAELLATAAAGPDLALVDLDLPPLGGIAAASELGAVSDVRIILWGVGAAPEGVLEAIRIGAAGFLRKEISGDGLLRALDGLARGEAPLGRELALGLIEALQRESGPNGMAARASTLSLREREVLECLVAGAQNKQIGAMLAISEFTVKRHVQNILRKLDVPTRAAAARAYVAAEQHALKTHARQPSAVS